MTSLKRYLEWINRTPLAWRAIHFLIAASLEVLSILLWHFPCGYGVVAYVSHEFTQAWDSRAWQKKNALDVAAACIGSLAVAVIWIVVKVIP